MGISTLDPNQALTSGADLWVMTLPQSSSWALQIDWLSNFQSLRSQKHEPARRSPELNQLLELTGQTAAVYSLTSGPTLIAVDRQLPCRWLLVAQNLEDQNLFKTLDDLNIATVRVFLPKTRSADPLSSHWAKESQKRDFQFVLE